MWTFDVRTDPVQINAPIDVVWAVLTDVDRYGEWNPFTPEIRTDFKIGSSVDMQVTMGRRMLDITEYVCAFEEPRLIAWQKAFGPRWWLHALREQHLEPLSEASCSYYNSDRLTGLLAPVVAVSSGGYMRRGFESVATGLKTQAEAIYASTRPDG